LTSSNSASPNHSPNSLHTAYYNAKWQCGNVGSHESITALPPPLPPPEGPLPDPPTPMLSLRRTSLSPVKERKCRQQEKSTRRKSQNCADKLTILRGPPFILPFQSQSQFRSQRNERQYVTQSLPHHQNPLHSTSPPSHIPRPATSHHKSDHPHIPPKPNSIHNPDPDLDQDLERNILSPLNPHPNPHPHLSSPSQHSPTPPPQFRKFLRRHKKKLWLVATVLLVLGITAGILAGILWRLTA
jgi:hypothetical protein